MIINLNLKSLWWKRTLEAMGDRCFGSGMNKIIRMNKSEIDSVGKSTSHTYINTHMSYKFYCF